MRRSALDVQLADIDAWTAYLALTFCSAYRWVRICGVEFRIILVLRDLRYPQTTTNLIYSLRFHPTTHFYSAVPFSINLFNEHSVWSLFTR
jgi:hypothetical protein